MSHRAILTHFMAMAIPGFLVAYGQQRLVRHETREGCPWCGPNRQVQVGQRSMGKSFYGDILKEFWIDDSGHEYDPEKIGEQVWGYIATTRLAKSIDDAKRQGQACAQMQIVSVNPVIVLLYPSEHQRLKGVGQNLSMGTRHPLELSWTANTAPVFAEPMQWLSPELRVGPTDITFTAAGEAESKLKTGVIKLARTSGLCKILRE